MIIKSQTNIKTVARCQNRSLGRRAFFGTTTGALFGAWGLLQLGDNSPQAALASPTLSPAKQVVLLGDSIRLGYQGAVQAALKGVAEVWAPADNGRTTRYTLAHVAQWLRDRPADVVHINCGLWDVARRDDQMKPADTPIIPLKEYRTNIHKIIDAIGKHTRGTIIWATTTPVDEKLHRQRRGFDRLNSDIVAYNQAAIAVSRKQGGGVNDLYQVVTEAGTEKCPWTDGVHFTAAGSKLLGDVVAQSIRSALEQFASSFSTQAAWVSGIPRTPRVEKWLNKTSLPTRGVR